MANKNIRESVDRFFDYDIWIEKRIITIVDTVNENGEQNEVDAQMAERVFKAFELFNETPDKPVKIILNTAGGDWDSGIAIYDTISLSPCHVVIEVRGCAMSMGSLILQAADERVLYPHATVMIHDGTLGYNTDTISFEKWGEYSKKHLRPKTYAIYAKKSGKDAKYWEKRCSHDYILSAEEAVEEGLADKVYGT